MFLDKFNNNFNFKIRRLDLLKYAKASGDFNKIHLDTLFAKSVGFSNVIVHGMLVMGYVIELLSKQFKNNFNKIIKYETNFLNPIEFSAVNKIDVNNEDFVQLKMNNEIISINKDNNVVQLRTNIILKNGLTALTCRTILSL